MGDYRLTPQQLESVTGASLLASHPDTRIEYNLPEKVYRDTGGCNGSFLKTIQPMPGNCAKFFRKLDKRHFRIGRHVHAAALQPELLGARLIPTPRRYPVDAPPERQSDWTSTANYCALWETKAINAGYDVFSPSDYAVIIGCVASLAQHPGIVRLIKNGHSEVSYFAKLKRNGQKFLGKCRTDVVPFSGSSMINLKTTADEGAAVDSFEREIWSRGYGLSAAYELFLHNKCNPSDQRYEYMWPVVEKAEPYCIAIYTADWDSLRPFRALMEERLDIFSACLRDGGVFPGDDINFRPI